MNTALTFLIKLQDMLTPGMRQAAQISNTASNQIQSQFAAIGSSGKRMGASVDELHARLQAINKVRFSTTIQKEFDVATKAAQKLENQIDKLQNKGSKSGGGGSSMLGSIVGGNLITKGIGMAGSALMGAGSAVIGASVKEEQNKVGLSTFLGKDGAAEAYANIKKDAAATPFDTQSLVSVNRALISAGLSAKDARIDTMNLGNAISAVGGTSVELERMAANMQQIKTVGKASAMDIKQFGIAGINIYQLLADVTGKNVDQVKDMDVSYELLSKALQHAGEKGGAYFGAMKAQSETVGGKWSTFMDNLMNTAADIGTALQPIFHFLLDMGIAITNNMGSIMPYLQPVIDGINAIPALIAEITSGTSNWAVYIDVIKSYAMKIWETSKSLFGNIWAIVGGVVTWMGKSELLKDIFLGIGQFAGGILDTITWIGNKIQWVWDNIISPILNAVDTFYSATKKLFGGGKSELEITTVTKGPVVTPGSLPNQPQVFGLGGLVKAPVVGLPEGVPVTNPVAMNDGRISQVSAKDLAGGGGKDNAKSKSESINSGGQRSIVINIQKVMDKIEQHIASGGREAADEFAGAVREALRRELNSLNAVAS